MTKQNLLEKKPEEPLQSFPECWKHPPWYTSPTHRPNTWHWDADLVSQISQRWAECDLDLSAVLSL